MTQSGAARTGRRPWWLCALAFSLGLLSGFSGLAGCDSRSGYAQKDGQWTYAGVGPFAQVDPGTFKPIDDKFAKDAQRGYFERIEIPGSHGPSFASLDVRAPEFARDRTQIYHGSNVPTN